jgi:histidinol-phosphate aminotransferase
VKNRRPEEEVFVSDSICSDRPNRPVARPGIAEITPYVGGEAKIPGVNRVIKLASNENALGPSALAIEALQNHAAAMHRYPDGGSVELRTALGGQFDIDPALIVCGTGSDELIQLLVRGFAGTGDEVIHSRHGFLMYAIAALAAGATPVAVAETDLTADVDQLLAAVTDRTKLVFLANPNNPTGTYLPASEIRRLHAGLPGNVVLVLDAAYAEFVDVADYEPGIELVQTAGNVVMLRTFSKLFALGGLRVGWGFCPPGIADVLNRLRGVFNVSSAAQAAALAALGDRDHQRRSKEHNRVWRRWTDEALVRLGLAVVPSQGNFLLVRLPDDPALNADAGFEYLKSRGIITRKMGAYHLSEYLRITIGTEEEMRLTVAGLADFLAQR